MPIITSATSVPGPLCPNSDPRCSPTSKKDAVKMPRSHPNQRFLFTHYNPVVIHDFQHYLISGEWVRYAKWQLEHNSFLFIHGYVETKEPVSLQALEQLMPGAFFVQAHDRLSSLKLLNNRASLGPWETGKMLREVKQAPPPAVEDEDIELIVRFQEQIGAQRVCEEIRDILNQTETDENERSEFEEDEKVLDSLLSEAQLGKFLHFRSSYQ